MKNNNLEAKYESDRLAAVVGVIAMYIAASAESVREDFPINIVYNVSQGAVVYFFLYLIMTAFCYMYHDKYIGDMAQAADVFRRKYYNFGAFLLPLSFVMATVNSLSWCDPVIKTIVISVSTIWYVRPIYKKYLSNRKNAKNKK